jgi:hypothetical protein
MEFFRPSEISAEVWKTVPKHARLEYNALLTNHKNVYALYNTSGLKKHLALSLKINKQLKEYHLWLEHIFIPPPPPPEIPDATSPETACCICLVKKVNRCLPCGHTLCSECLPKLTECSCPTCRTAFKMETVKPLFL